MELKYGSVGGQWCSGEVGKSYGVGVWKNVRSGGFALISLDVVGDGHEDIFWNDVWCRNQSSKRLDIIQCKRIVYCICINLHRLLK